MDALAVTLFGITFSGTLALVVLVIGLIIVGGAAWFWRSRRR